MDYLECDNRIKEESKRKTIKYSNDELKHKQRTRIQITSDAFDV